MKQIDILGKLFGSTNRVKLLKFFLLNQGGFSLDVIAKRLKANPAAIRNELALLKKIGFIKQKTLWVELGGKKKKKKRKDGFFVCNDFSLQHGIYTLVIESGGMHIPDIISRFTQAGKISLFIVSGIFIQDAERLLDLMIVGDRLNRKRIDREIKILESEIGKELRYAVFTVNEFMYRLNMYDKLLRDVLDFPHEKVINRIDHPELR